MLQRNETYPSSFCGIIGKSKPMQDLFESINKFAPLKKTIVILGASGTGKELVARAIHLNSSRSNKAFVAVNCSAIPDNLIEREMFGHEKGAFTGAYTTAPGFFEMSHEGTLFLDEIADMALPAQAKILRILEEKKIKRLGGSRIISVDVRIVAATNRDLNVGVKEGWFREDLYYRVNVLLIQVPQLRYRTGDIPLLIEHFLERFAKENGKGEMSISTEAVQALQKYPFTGNVRELENVITKASVNANGREISLNNLPNDILQNLNPREKDNIIQRAVILTDSPVIDESNLPKDLVSGLKTGLNAAPDPDVWVETETLLEALKKVAIFNKQGDKKLWHEGLRCITIDDIHLFLVMQCAQWFSRKELAKFLRNNSKSDTDKYKTAGGYLKILKENKICVHNGKHANRSRYRLAGRFIATAKSR